MATDRKRMLVTKLVELTVPNPIRGISGNPSELDIEMHEQVQKRFQDQQIEIRMRHFSTEQLEALLDFYATDIGASILKTQREISEEITAGFQVISNDVSEEYREKRHQEAIKRANEHKNDARDDDT